MPNFSKHLKIQNVFMVRGNEIIAEAAMAVASVPR